MWANTAEGIQTIAWKRVPGANERQTSTGPRAHFAQICVCGTCKLQFCTARLKKQPAKAFTKRFCRLFVRMTEPLRLFGFILQVDFKAGREFAVHLVPCFAGCNRVEDD